MAASVLSSDSVSSKVELSISCSNLKDLDRFSKSDPVVFLFEKRAQQWVVVARTEVIDDNLNPKVKRKDADTSYCYFFPTIYIPLFFLLV